MALDRFIEAVDCCDHALLVDSQNGEVAKLRASILEKADRVERRGKELEERERRQKEMKIALDKGYLVRRLPPSLRRLGAYGEANSQTKMWPAFGFCS